MQTVAGINIGLTISFILIVVNIVVINCYYLLPHLNLQKTLDIFHPSLHYKLQILPTKKCYWKQYIKTSKVPSDKSSRGHTTFISSHHKEIEDTYAISKAVQLKVQGQWTRWLNYIQQNFSWKSLLAMPVNLTSFCISSTYDTLPSPSNLKRWKLTTEASCFLCNKDTCATSYILGTCKVALSQGRFYFHHDNVLRIVISNKRSSIKTIKSSVPSPKQTLKVKFVKKGTKVKTKNSSPTGRIFTSGIRLGLVRGSRWHFFLSTSHRIY